jgi:hypothetical protein
MTAFYSPGGNPLLDRVLMLPAHAEITIQKGSIPHPTSLGFEQSLGEPHGQVADFRAALPDGRGVHIRDMVTRWTVHWDKVFPSQDRWVEHLRVDSPGWFMALIAGLLAAAIALILIAAFLLSGG